MFQVGDLVKVEVKAVSTLGIPAEEISGLLVVNDVVTEHESITGIQLLEVRNADGDYFGLLGNVLEAV
jgi:hypothetical protein